MGQVFKIKMCKRIFADQTNDAYGIPFYKIGTIGGIADAYIDEGLYETLKTKYPFPKVGEVLVTCSGTIGRIFQYDGKDAYFQDSNIVWVQNDEKHITNDFVRVTMENQDWGKLNKSTIKRLFVSDLDEMTITYPNDFSEQKKITNFLNLIGKKNETLASKKEILKKYKEGQQKLIFSGNKFQKISLNKIVDFQSKSKYGAGAGMDGGKYPFYLSGDKISSSNEYLCDGCYVIANDGGEANFRITNGKFLYSDHCICFRAKDDNLTNYIYNYLQSIRNKITYFGFVGSGLKNVDRDYFENLNIPIVNTDETSKISSFFLTIDKMISIYEDKEEKIKQINSYLLKSMFI